MCELKESLNSVRESMGRVRQGHAGSHPRGRHNAFNLKGADFIQRLFNLNPRQAVTCTSLKIVHSMDGSEAGVVGGCGRGNKASSFEADSVTLHRCLP